ncbi:hypothetical protein [Rhodococcus oryzae]|uniref:hypothetical protein n=1 Tax=Rhodococcus oryzae TaxID=2571143 RepID=UPI0037B0B7AA
MTDSVTTVSITEIRRLLAQSSLDRTAVDIADGLLAGVGPADQHVEVHETDRQVAVTIYERRWRRELKSGAVVHGTQDLLSGLENADCETVWMAMPAVAGRAVILWFDSAIAEVLGCVVTSLPGPLRRHV